MFELVFQFLRTILTPITVMVIGAYVLLKINRKRERAKAKERWQTQKAESDEKMDALKRKSEELEESAESEE